MELFLKIGSAILIVLMIAFIWPRARHMMENSPKASANDWLEAALPIGGVILFVIILTQFV